jgi:ABC-type transport system involved in cytochrome c biogenesis ATPase subunit
MRDHLGPLVRTRNLIVGYAGKAVAAIPDLDLVGGLVWHVTGSNGSGKTTLLKTLAGLAKPVSGAVERRCRMGAHGAIYVHSAPYLFVGSVRRNLTLAQPHHDVRVIADAFGLSRLLDHEATRLSHGQQRRLALARALVGRPALLLVDEPEGGLDDEAIAAWRTCVMRAVQAGEPVLVVAAHRPLAIEASSVSEVHLSQPVVCPSETSR